MALINIKFKIEQKSSGKVKVNEEMHASLHGVNYTKKPLFKAEFVKLFWLTYTKGFAPLLIEKMKVPNMTSDAGWGCVIRSAQMLVANAMQKVYIHQYLSDNMKLKLQAGILNLFNDDVRQENRCAFSIQNICELGLVDHGHMPGEWYGVQRISKIFEKLGQTYQFHAYLDYLASQTNDAPDTLMASSNMQLEYQRKKQPFKIVSMISGDLIVANVLEAAIGKLKFEKKVNNGNLKP